MEETALEKFMMLGGMEEENPMERLRFFCSLAMNGEDWLDLEAFIDDVKTMPPSNAGIERHAPESDCDSEKDSNRVSARMTC